MIYWRPLVQSGEARPNGAVPLAGGPLWFSQVERLERRLAAEEGLDEEGRTNARIAAGIAFALEYQKRGLGGSRPWCRDEGQQAVRPVAPVPEKPAPPPTSP